MRRGCVVPFMVIVAGCGEFLGVNEYTVTDECASGTVKNPSGECVEVPICASDELPVAGGACMPLGIETCPDGFEDDPEHPGGCREIIPECPPPNLNRLGTTECGTGLTCASQPIAATSALTLEVHQDGTTGPNVFSSIQAAIDYATAQAAVDAQILIYKGTYRESLLVERPLRLVGR